MRREPSRWLSAAGSLLCLAGFSACAREATAPASPPRETITRPTAAVEQPSANDCDLQRIIERATVLRGLPLLSEVHCELLERAELAKRALEVSLRDTPEPFLQAQEQFIVLLELGSSRFDLHAAIRALIEQELAGFYDPQRDTLYVMRELDPDSGDTALVHEVVHALQDQHFDLGTRMAQANTSDQLAALQILAEGDATSAMLELPRTPGEVPQAVVQGLANMTAFLAEATPSDVEVPRLFRRSLMALYSDGLQVVELQRAQGGWQAVDAMWQANLQSSATVLHGVRPELTRTVPPLPEPPSWRGQTPRLNDVIGEQGLRLLFEEWESRARAREAAQGLVDDKLSFFGDRRDGALLWQLRFASVEDTEQALRAFGRGYFPDASGSETAKPWLRGCAAAEHNPMALLRRGEGLLLAVQSAGAGASTGCVELGRWLSSAAQRFTRPAAAAVGATP